MAFEESNGNAMYMPVAPAYGGYGNNGFGSDWAWIIILLLCGWGGMGGMGGSMNNVYPWLNQSNQVADGFANQTNTMYLNNLSNGITSGFGDVQTALCGGFAGVTAAVNNGFAQSEIAANARQISDLQQMFALQSQLAQCCCENRLASANLEASLAREACATRSAITSGNQAILDKMCQQELDAERRDNANLRSELLYARGQASQVAQTSAIEASQNAQTQYIVNRVAPYPIPAYIVANPTTGGTTAGA